MVTDDYIKNIVVVPTSGNIKDSQKGVVPGRIGRLRAEKARDLIPEERSGFGLTVFLGGHRTEYRSEAEVLALWELEQRNGRELLKNGLPDSAKLSNAISRHYCFALSGGNCTGVDTRELANWIREMFLRPTELQIVIVTHPVQGELMKATLATFGFTNVEIIDSGEPCPYKNKKLTILKWINKKDPKYQGWPSLLVRFVTWWRRFRI